MSGDPARPTEGLPRAPVRPLPERASVLGLGVTGVPVACYLARHGADVLATDSRPEIPAEAAEALARAGVSVELGGNRVRPGDAVLISPGIPPHHPLFQEAHRLGAEVLSEPELFARRFGRPIVAVTGTDGKSTVTTWTAHLMARAGLRAVAGGNLGNPLIAEADRPDLDAAVVEISAFQLLSTHTLLPAAAAITNLADDHLDYFNGSRADYAAAKRKLLDLCAPGSLALRPDGDEVLAGWPLPRGAVDGRIALAPGPGILGWLASDRLWLAPRCFPALQGPGQHPLQIAHAGELPLVGRHNILNALFSAALAAHLGAAPGAIRAGLLDYAPLPHRCEVVSSVAGVRFVDDSKATNPHAASAALRGLDGALVLICGGSEKGSDFAELGRLAAERTRAVVATGDTAERILAALPEDHPRALAADLREAVRAASRFAEPGDTVLLSPACASFDRFFSYAHRGQVFQELVAELAAESSDEGVDPSNAGDPREVES